jgi:hypothetical protein
MSFLMLPSPKNGMRCKVSKAIRSFSGSKVIDFQLQETTFLNVNKMLRGSFGKP